MIVFGDCVDRLEAMVDKKRKNFVDLSPKSNSAATLTEHSTCSTKLLATTMMNSSSAKKINDFQVSAKNINT